MTIEIIIVHPPDYNEQANLPVVSLLSLRKKDGLSMGFKHNRVLSLAQRRRTAARQANRAHRRLAQQATGTALYGGAAVYGRTRSTADQETSRVSQ